MTLSAAFLAVAPVALSVRSRMFAVFSMKWLVAVLVSARTRITPLLTVIPVPIALRAALFKSVATSIFHLFQRRELPSLLVHS